MSRGFNTTFGVGATDVITTGYTTALTGPRSYFFWGYQSGAVGGLGRVFSKGSGRDEDFFWDETNTRLDFQLNNGTNGGWSTPIPTSGLTQNVWHSVLLTHPGAAGNVFFYLDGTQIIVNNASWTSNPSSANPFIIGNATTANRCFGGKLAWFTIWDGVQLNQSEATALANGVVPFRIRPDKIVTCLPLWGLTSPEVDIVVHGTAALTGTAKQDGPPMELFTRMSPFFFKPTPAPVVVVRQIGLFSPQFIYRSRTVPI